MKMWLFFIFGCGAIIFNSQAWADFPICSEVGTRCLEKLDRDSDSLAFIQADQLSQDVMFMNPKPLACERFGGALNGIKFEDHAESGWWGDIAPNKNSYPTRIASNRLALSSPACREIKLGPSARAWCEQLGGYETIHLYLSLSDGFMDKYTRSIAVRDPWYKQNSTRTNVYFLHVNGFEEIQQVISNLLASCKVIDYVAIGSHGYNGKVTTKKGDAYKYQPVAQFIGETLSLCALSLKARVQFLGCNIGGSVDLTTKTIKDKLESILNSKNFTSPDNPTPLDGVRVLSHRTETYIFNPSLLEELFGSHPKMRKPARDAIVFTVKGSDRILIDQLLDPWL